MISDMSPTARLSLAESKQLAIRGSLREAAGVLRTRSEKARNEHRILDYVYLKMGWAEVLYTDCREEEAQSVFRDEIDPVLADVSTSLRVVVDLNRATVGLATWDPESTREFYRLVDLRRFAGPDARDERTLLFGEDSSRSARYYDSVPTFWRAVLEAHETGHWQSLYSAYKRLGIECTKADLAKNAAYCAVRSLDESVVSDAADLLSKCRDPRVTATAINAIVASSYLLRNARVTVALVCKLADFVPEEEFTSLFDWVLSRVVLEPWNRTSAEAIAQIWKSLSKAGWRLDPTQSGRVVTSVLKHPFATGASRYRSIAITLLTGCLPSVASEELKAIADWGAGVLEDVHVTERDALVHMLAEAAMRADTPTKSWLARRLGFSNLGKATSVCEPICRSLGFRPADDDLKRYAADASRQIGLQIQRGAPGFAPDTKISHSLKSEFKSESESVFVFVPGGAREFDSVVAHAKHLTRTSIEQLFDASLAQLDDPGNALANKLFLVEDLTELVPYLTEAEADRLEGVLAHIGSAPIEESPFVGASTSPLSPFQTNLGTPADLQARAILTMAKLAARSFDRFGAQAVNFTSRGLADASEVVRSSAVASIKHFPIIAEDLVLGLLVATRDRDTSVSATAFSVLTWSENLQLSGAQKRVLASSIRQALDTPNVRVRWAAARALAAPTLRDLPDDLRAQYEEVQQYVGTDPSRAVRLLANVPRTEQHSPPAE